MSEKQVLNKIDLAVNRAPLSRIFPNVCGRFMGYNPATGASYMVQTGLKKGSADRIGWQSVQITDGMVGRYIAQFVSIEAKANCSSRLRDDQKEWCDIVLAFGGAAIITHTPETVPAVLKELSKGVAVPPDFK